MNTAPVSLRLRIARLYAHSARALTRTPAHAYGRTHLHAHDESPY